MKQYWSKKAAALSPYTAGEQPREKLIKLNTNENAFPPSDHVAPAIESMLHNLRLYPQPDSDLLREALAEHHGVTPGQVFCANGSDEALAMCYLAFFDPGTPVRTLDITYTFFPVWAQLFDITLKVVPLREDFTVDVEAMCGGRNVILANPNAPTGIALPIGELEEIIRNTHGVVVVDEAYVDFSEESAEPLLKKYDNLVIVRTFSKGYSLAGLRVGYVLASENLIEALFAVKDSFNSYPVDVLAQAGAVAALGDIKYHDKTVQNIVDTRKYTAGRLEEMGFQVLPSSANFIFIHCEDAAALLNKLRKKGILVRHFPARRTKDYLRVTIGTYEQMQAFFEAMEGIV